MVGKKGNWETSLRVLLASLSTVAAYADLPAGLVGGQMDTGDAYAGFISSDGTGLTLIPGLPTNGYINAVGLNSSGTGLLVGRADSTNGYAAFVSPDMTLTPFTFSFANGQLMKAAINESGIGFVGGDTVSGDWYVAYLFPDQTINRINPNLFTFGDVALNDSDVGLIGGEGGDDAAFYAAFSDIDGNINRISISTDIGRILAVDLNNQGVGVVGGQQSFAPVPYGALVYASSPAVPLTPLPTGDAKIQTVAINESGIGLVGGYEQGNQAYAGSFDVDGNLTPLFLSPLTGAINSVALNESGEGIIGGQLNGSDLYAAFVKDGVLGNSFFTSQKTGTIYSVAINDAGVGLIGGFTDESNAVNAYAALVAPNGTVNRLDILDGLLINSVAIQSIGQNILNQITPGSTGPYGSIFYMQLAAASALQNRWIQQNRTWTSAQTNSSSGGSVSMNETNVALNELQSLGMEMNVAQNPKIASMPIKTAPCLNQDSVWIEPFGDFVQLKKEGSIPKMQNHVGGVLVGYDHQGFDYIVGVTLGYAFNYVSLSESLGHSKLQEEMASLYGSYYSDHFWVAAALWGGGYQVRNVRHTLSLFTSKAKTHGWILEPHLEFASPWALDQNQLYYVEPFVLFDWVNNWQNSYTESGSSGLNLHVPSIYNSLLQSEAGLRFYENFLFDWGNIYLMEKFSYVNQAPFDVHSATTAFAGASSSFPIAIASTEVQNLGAVQFLASFVPCDTSYPYGGFSFEVKANGAYQSYFGSVYTGIDF